MTVLSTREIADLVSAAGFTGHDRAVAVAIVLAESRGDPAAVGDKAIVSATWGPSIGLFQIRSLRDQRGSGGVRDELVNSDPRTNARHAHSIYAAAHNTFGDWSTFTGGAYEAHLAAAEAAVGAAGPSPAVVALNAHADYVVRAGDTLTAIAAAHGTTLAHVRQLNPGLFDAAHKHGNVIHQGEHVHL